LDVINELTLHQSFPARTLLRHGGGDESPPQPDTARKWYNGYKNEVNTHTAAWQTIKEALEEAFDNAEYKELLEIKLLNRRRLEGERLESYIYDVLDMCRQIDETMPDKLKIRHVRRGLNSELYDSLAAASQEDLKMFLSAVKGAEALRFLKKEKSKPTELIPPAAAGVTVNNIQQIPAQMGATQEENSQTELLNMLVKKIDGLAMNQSRGGYRGRGNYYRPNQTRGGSFRGRGRGYANQQYSSRIVCYGCNTPGHIQSECRRSSYRGARGQYKKTLAIEGGNAPGQTR
jgi:Retrotransposon gag protein